MMRYQVYIACLMLLAYCGCAVADGYYTISAAKEVRPGQQWPVAVSLYGVTSSVTVRLSLSAGGAPVASNSATFQRNDVQIIQLQIPNQLPKGNLVLTADGTGDLSFHNTTDINQLEAATKTAAIFIQTDKAMYKPSQKVLFRTVVVDPNLKPVSNTIDIRVKDPNDNVIKQWMNESGIQGVTSHELQLSNQPVLGDWTIVTKLNDETTEKVFTVAEYVLPKFEVKVNLPTFHLVTQDSITFSISAKYTYGKNVNGLATIALQLLSSCSYYNTTVYKLIYDTCPIITITKNLIEGQATVTVSRKELQTLVYISPQEQQSPDITLTSGTLSVEANVTETLTGITLSGKNSVPLTTDKYKLEILDITPNTFKPHLMYYGFLKVSQYDGQPPVMSDFVKDGVPVKVKITFQVEYRVTTAMGDTYGSNSSDAFYPVTENGLIRFSFSMASYSGISYQSLNIRVELTPVGANAPLSQNKYVQKFLSQSDQGIQLSILNVGNVKPTETISFVLNITTSVNQCFYQLVSKGSIVVSRPLIVSNEQSILFQLALDASLAQRLSPSTTAVALCLLPSGELLADSIDFNVDGAFTNDVSVSFGKNEVSPADEVNVIVSAQANSYIGLLAVDQSVLLLKGGNDLSSDQILQELRKFDPTNSDSSSDNNNFGRFGRPIDRRKRMIWCMDCGIWWPIPRGGKDTADILKQAGLVVMTNAIIFKSPTYRDFMAFDAAVPMMAMAGKGNGDMFFKGNAERMDMLVMSDVSESSELQDVTTVRRTFPETWLWTNEVLRANGTWQFTATVPDTITSWVASAFAVSDIAGLGLAPTAKLTAFKPFFVSLTVPYSVIRGEEFALTVTVFNYLTSNLPVLITIKGSTDFGLRLPNDIESISHNDYTQTIQVSAGNGASMQIWVKPERLGQIPITVKAQSTAAADAVEQMLLVEPEGFPEEYTQSVFLDMSSTNSLTKSVTVNFPPNVVSDSQFVRVTLAADIMGQTIAGLDRLLQMPYGCGEQNMLTMVPNIYVLDYLTQTNQVTSVIRDKAISYMENGYQRELTYQRTDSSFSAFGQSDTAGSTWLTAFVVKSFEQASKYIYIDPNVLTNSLSWLTKQQQSNGNFTEPAGGRVIHTEMQGGSSKGLTMTSYVLTALLEVKQGSNLVDADVKRAVDVSINRAVSFLSGKLSLIENDAYSLAVTTYALTLASSSSASIAFSMLEKLAINKDGLKYWQVGSDDSCETTNRWHPPTCQAAASNIELNAYALLSYITKNDLSSAINVMKWLTAQRNSLGGFASTQDTVMALMALSKFAALTSQSDSLNMEVSIKTDTQQSHSFDKLMKSNAAVMQMYEITKPIQSVTITASGKGIALIQVSVKYNVEEVNNKPTVILNLKSWKEVNNMYGIRACTRWTADSNSGMGLVNVNALSGTSWTDTDNIISQLKGLAKRVELNDKTLTVYFDELPSEEKCFTAFMQTEIQVANMQDARAEALAYYTPEKNARMLYLPSGKEVSRCSGCPECCTGKNGASTSHVTGLTYAIVSILGVLLATYMTYSV